MNSSLSQFEKNIDARIAELDLITERQRYLIHFLRSYKRNKAQLTPLKNCESGISEHNTNENRPHDKKLDGANETASNKSNNGAFGIARASDFSHVSDAKYESKSDSKKESKDDILCDISQLDAILNQARMIRSNQSKSKSLTNSTGSVSNTQNSNKTNSIPDAAPAKSKVDSTKPPKAPVPSSVVSKVRDTSRVSRPASKQQPTDGPTNSAKQSTSISSIAIVNARSSSSNMKGSVQLAPSPALQTPQLLQETAPVTRSLNQRDILLLIMHKFSSHKNILNPINIVSPMQNASLQYNILKAVLKSSVVVPSCPLIDCLYSQLFRPGFPLVFISNSGRVEVSNSTKKSIYDKMTLKIKEMQRKYDKILKSRIQRCHVDHLDGVDRKEILYNWLIMYAMSRIAQALSSNKVVSNQRQSDRSKGSSIIEHVDIYLNQLKSTPIIFDVKKPGSSIKDDILQRMQSKQWRSLVTSHLTRYYLSFSTKAKFVLEAIIARDFLQSVILKIKNLCKKSPFLHSKIANESAGPSIMSSDELDDWKATLKCYRNIFHVLTGGFDSRSECFFFTAIK